MSLRRARLACELAKGKMTMTLKIPMVATRMAKRTSTMVTAVRLRRREWSKVESRKSKVEGRKSKVESVMLFGLCLLAIRGEQAAVGKVSRLAGGFTRVDRLQLTTDLQIG